MAYLNALERPDANRSGIIYHICTTPPGPAEESKTSARVTGGHKIMAKRILIIGAVALGPKVACRLRRLDPDAEITVIDRDNLISYGGCGIPYYVGGDVNDIEGLCSTTAHVLRDPGFFNDCKGIQILPRVEAKEINRKEKTLTVTHLETGEPQDLPYDKLVIATGATPFTPPIPGADLPQVHTVSNLHSAKAIKDMIAGGQVGSAVVIGAGAIGIEMAEALTDLWGIETTLIEMADQILPTAISRDLARMAENHLEENEVKVMTSERVNKILGDADTGVTGVETGSGVIECDLVVMSAGVRANTDFAERAGLACGRTGGLIVDRCLRTTDPDIYAGGDCIELRNLVSGENMTMPLGSLANREGRIIANNIHGRAAKLKGVVGTFNIKIFEMGVATAGLTFNQAKAAGFDPVYTLVAQHDRAHFYPNAKMMFMTLIADRKTRTVLGVEALGRQVDAVKGRVDALAPLLQIGMDVDDVCTTEVGYAPPFAAAMDIVNNAGNVMDNILNGGNTPIDFLDALELFKADKTRFVDVRDAREAAPYVEKYGDKWLSIPQPEFRKRLEEIPADEHICLICGTGARSYECQTVLQHAGRTNTVNIQGGHAALVALAPDFVETQVEVTGP